MTATKGIEQGEGFATWMDGAVLVLELQRDAKRNALTQTMCCELATRIEHAPEEARAVLLRSQGSVFCAGADLSEATNGQFHSALMALIHQLQTTPLPVVADIQGAAVGAGMQLTMACDLRVLGEGAWFQIPAARLGFGLDNWTIRRLMALVGGGRARSVLLAMERISLEEAITCGLATRTGGSEEAMGLAQELSELAPLSLQQFKAVLNDQGFTPQLSANHQRMYDACWASEDAKEAAAARLEKRKPKFTGK